MKQEQGMSLVELLIATAVTGIIVSVLGTAVYQTITVSEFGNDKITALHELQNTVHWVGMDVQKALTATGGSELVLTLPDSSSITYSLSGTRLHRTAGGSQMTLARNISSISFSIENRIVTMEIASTPTGRQGVVEQETYRIYLRPAEG